MAKEIKGGSFMFPSVSVDPNDVFTPEDLSEEHLMISKTAEDFVAKEVWEQRQEMEEHDKKLDINVKLLKKAGELGLLAVDVAEEYGGLQLDMTTSMMVTEKMARVGSWATTFAAHVGIGTLPIVYFGTKQQKEKYLPKLASGEWIAAYALTEENYGSDALNAKTTARLSEDGKYYILNGTKQFITNAGFADVFVVYAQIVDPEDKDKKQFSAFIVERSFEGVSTGPEEHKMGIRGSSTRQLILEDVKVPVENLLGEPGKGHVCALNILNLGRLKLGFGSLGASKDLMAEAASYANQRKQFGKPIGSFGMIQRKIADMYTGIYSTESMCYRTSGMIDLKLEELDRSDEDFDKKAVKTMEEYAIEASIMKVYGSEVLGRTVDDAVQVHGGYGFIEEYPVAGAYRDARINRIFEGTNEINRLLIPGTLMRRTLKGQLDLNSEVMAVLAEIKSDSIPKEPQDGPLGMEKTVRDLLKRMVVYGAGVPAQKYMMELINKQIILELVADMAMDLYAVDSSILRTEKIIANQGEEKAKWAILATRIIAWEKLQANLTRLWAILSECAEGNSDEFAKYKKAFDRMQLNYDIPIASMKEELAKFVLEHERYIVVL